MGTYDEKHTILDATESRSSTRATIPQACFAQGSVAVTVDPPVLISVRFGEFLCQRKRISEEQLVGALADHWSNGGRIGAAICRLGFLEHAEIESEAKAFHSLDTVEV